MTNLTGVSVQTWDRYVGHELEYKYTDYLLADVIAAYGYLPKSYKDFDFVYFHVTISANGCASFLKYGILDLKQSYMCSDSELRMFLEDNDIHIDLDERLLTHNGHRYDISYGARPREHKETDKCWSVGRTFYYDFTTCGFLSVWGKSPYGGQVHRRPEILMDIDNLLGLNLSLAWATSHDSYEIVAKVSGDNIIYDSDDDQCDEDKVLNYLTKAYVTDFGEPYENVLLIKNHIQIPPSDIIEIRPLSQWR